MSKRRTKTNRGAAAAPLESSFSAAAVITTTAPVNVGFDPRLIPEFNGDDGRDNVVEWFTRAAILCEHYGADLARVLPARLTGGAFAVWVQLPEEGRRSLDAVRSALYAAFAMDPLAAYDAYTSRRLQPGESPDVYLADLRRLTALFGGVPDKALACAFIAGLPDTVRSTIRAGTRAEALDLPSIVARARAVLSDERTSGMAAAAGKGGEARATHQQRRQPPRCWTCGKTGHLARQCPNDREAASARAPSPTL